jgi:hypothetical protein
MAKTPSLSSLLRGIEEFCYVLEMSMPAPSGCGNKAVMREV